MPLYSRCVECMRTSEMLERGASYLLAVSAGVDSMAMMHLFSELRKKWYLDLHAVYVNHGLRPEAEQEAAFFSDAATALKISNYIVSIDVQEEARQREGSVQEIAREMRYDVLERLRAELDVQYIATAHHADDQAETLLAHFLKGAGPEGLAGIRPKREHIIRPLLFASRKEILTYVEKHSIEWMEDASNSQTKYQRNKIRHKVLPVLQECVNPAVVQTLARSAGVFQEFERFHEAVAQKRYEESVTEEKNAISLAVQQLKGYFEAEAYLVIRRALERAGCERMGYSHVRSVYGLLSMRTGSVIQLPGGFVALRDRKVVQIMPEQIQNDTPATVRLGERIQALGLQFLAETVEPGDVFFSRDTLEEYIDCDAAGDEWTLRRWQPGDVFHPIGFRAPVKVSDFLTDMKISAAAKSQVVVLEREGAIVWVCGFRLSEQCKITAQTKRFARIRIDALND